MFLYGACHGLIREYYCLETGVQKQLSEKKRLETKRSPTQSVSSFKSLQGVKNIAPDLYVCVEFS